MTTLKPGDEAPDINATDQKGNSISLKDYSGKKVVLYFYPKDSTPGCTAEACSLRDNYDQLLEKGFGLSRYTSVAREAAKSGYWPKNRTLPVTLDEAVSGFTEEKHG